MPNNKKKKIAAGIMGTGLALGLFALYIVAAATLLNLPRKHHPKYSRETQEHWIAEIASHFNCTAIEFKDRLSESVFNCTTSDPFTLDRLHQLVVKNLTFKTGHGGNHDADLAGTIMLCALPLVIALTGGVGFGLIMLTYGILTLIQKLGTSIANRSSESTRRIMGHLGCYEQLEEEAQQDVDVEHASSTTSSSSTPNTVTEPTLQPSSVAPQVETDSLTPGEGQEGNNDQIPETPTTDADYETPAYSS